MKWLVDTLQSDWLAGPWGLGNSPCPSSGHNATPPWTALPHFTIGFSPKATKHNRVTICSCFSDWSVCGWKEFKKSTRPGSDAPHPHSLLRCPRGALTTAPITHRATLPPQGCGIHGDLQHRSMWLSGTGANQNGKSGPENSPDTEAMRHLPRTLWEGRHRSSPLIPFPLVLPAYVWQKDSDHRLSGTDLQSKASG